MKRAPYECKLRAAGFMADFAFLTDGPKNKPSRATLGMVVDSKRFSITYNILYVNKKIPQYMS
jgi:hypothetical protein